MGRRMLGENGAGWQCGDGVMAMSGRRGRFPGELCRFHQGVASRQASTSRRRPAVPVDARFSR